MYTRRCYPITQFRINPFYPRFYNNSNWVNQTLTNFGEMEDVNQISTINQVFRPEMPLELLEEKYV